MIILKPLILDLTGWLEATWVNSVQAPDIVNPAKDAVYEMVDDGMGNLVPNELISPAEPEHVEPGAVTETQVQCTSYHPTQIDMLRSDAAKHGTALDEYEAHLATWVAAYVPPTPEPEPVQVVESPVEKLQAFLNANPDVRALLQ